MNRRGFLSLTAAATLAAPLRALAQQPQMKRLGFLFTLAADDLQTPPYAAAVRAGLSSQGWQEGENLTIVSSWGSNTADAAKQAVPLLIASRPDVIIAVSNVNNLELVAERVATPIVMALVSDPVGLGLVDSLAHPSGNLTGLTNLDPSVGSKLVELLKELEPNLRRVAYLKSPQATGDWSAAIEAGATKLGLPVDAVAVNTVGDFAPAVEKIAAVNGIGLVVGLDVFLTTNHSAVAAAAAKSRVPAVYAHALYAADGGLLTYAVDQLDVMEYAAEYAGRILNGAKIADLPVQQPTKYQLTVNLRTARDLGLTVPSSIVLRADQVIS